MYLAFPQPLLISPLSKTQSQGQTLRMAGLEVSNMNLTTTGSSGSPRNMYTMFMYGYKNERAGCKG